MTRETYRLNVVTGSGEYNVLGPEDELRTVFDEWHEAGDATGGRLLIVGDHDVHDRVTIRHSIAKEAIVSMSLLRWSRN